MDQPNILLISADGLRADHLGCYGYRWDTSPGIDALAQSGVLCEQVMAPAIPTIPSYTTLYTAQHPIVHNIVSHPPNNQIQQTAPFLPREFLQADYTTCAVDSLMRLRPWMGRGYEYYIDPSQRHTMLYLGVTCEDLNHRAIPWLKDHSAEPFFMLIHYWDPHWPFLPPERYRDLYYEGDNPTDPDNHALDGWWQHPTGAIARDTWLRTADGLVTDPDYVTALFDREVRYLDDGITRLLESLDEIGLTENTIVIFTADHGVNLYEHGICFDHMYGLYDGNIRVPFIIRWPGHLPDGVRLDQTLQISDIAPTLLEAADVPVHPDMEGRSFWKLLTAEEKEGGHDRVISLECTYQARWSLRTDQYKLIWPPGPDGGEGGPQRELYDLRADPQETNNIAESAPAKADAMQSELQDWIAQKLSALGRDEDPLLAHGTTIGHGF